MLQLAVLPGLLALLLVPAAAPRPPSPALARTRAPALAAALSAALAAALSAALPTTLSPAPVPRFASGS